MTTTYHIVRINLMDRRQIKQFINLPFSIYNNTSQWVPPLAGDAAQVFDRQGNPYYHHSKAAFFLALDDRRQPAARLAVLDNRRYNQYNRCQTAFFCLFECQDDLELSGALFEAGFDWARSRGLFDIIGPKGFTALDGLGLLVAGFEHRPALGIPYNPSYYAKLIEAAGFQSTGELVSGYLSRENYQYPEKIHQIAELVKQRRGLHVATCRTRRDLRALLPKLQELYNASLGGSTGNTPLLAEEVKVMADQMLWFADPRLIKIVMKADEPVGFLLAYPDISAALQRTKGRLFPFGWIDLLLELRRTKWININGAGIAEKYRGVGGTALLFSELYLTLIDYRYDHADLVQVGVENDRMQRELRDLGIDFYKRHRMYRREL